MKIKTSELTGAALDWAVAQCEISAWVKYDKALHADLSLPARPIEYLRDYEFGPGFAPSSDWAQGGPIIASMGGGFTLKTWLQTSVETRCEAHLHNYDGNWIEFGPTELIAVMRCYVASRLGETVDVPTELLS